MRKPSFTHFRPLILAPKINKKTYVFKAVSWISFFLFVFRFFSKTIDLGTRFEIRWGQKWYQNRPSGAKHLNKSYGGCSFGPFCFKPCFHETKVITVPLGHRGF
jgi:hypothetical protein